MPTSSRPTFNAAGWLRFLDRVEHGGELHSLIVRRAGTTVIEAYAAPWSADDPQLLYSLSKTFTSAATGIAAERGALAWDDTLAELFPDQVDERVGAIARSIRVRDLLAMASGHTDDMWGAVAQETTVMYNRSSIGAFLRAEPARTPGSIFAYNQPCTWALSRAVADRTGADVLSLLHEEVFPALGVERALWIRDDDGVPIGFSGLHLRPRDVAAFFALVADGGIRDGEQLLPAEWIARHRLVQVDNGDVDEPNDWAQGYGWQVWQSRHGYRGDGAFGQFGVIVPEHSLVVTMTGCTDDMQGVLDALWEEVLPGLHLSDDAVAVETLQARLSTWRVATLPTLRRPPTAWAGAWNGEDARLRIDGDRITWSWTDDGGFHTIPVGHGEWEPGVIRWADDNLSVATCVGESDGGVTIRIAVRNTPHTFVLTLGTDGVAHPSWNHVPLHGDRLRDHAHPFDVLGSA